MVIIFLEENTNWWVDLLTILFAGGALYVSIRAATASFGSSGTEVMSLFFEEDRRFSDEILQYQLELQKRRNGCEDQMQMDEAAFDTWWTERYIAAYRGYYNVVDYVCNKYLRWQISRKAFREVLGPEIVRLKTDPDQIKMARKYGVSEKTLTAINKVYKKLPKWLKKEFSRAPE